MDKFISTCPSNKYIQCMKAIRITYTVNYGLRGRMGEGWMRHLILVPHTLKVKPPVYIYLKNMIKNKLYQIPRGTQIIVLYLR